jgi:hypothetical protein
VSLAIQVAPSVGESRSMESDELTLLEARWWLDDLDPDDLHDVADNFLSQGVQSQALIDLFLLTDDELPGNGPELFQRVLVELGGGDMARV